MRNFSELRQSLARPFLVGIALLGVAGLGGCMWHHDHDGDYGRPAGYRDHDERWHGEHDRDMDRDHYEHHDWDRR